MRRAAGIERDRACEVELVPSAGAEQSAIADPEDHPVERELPDATRWAHAIAETALMSM